MLCVVPRVRSQKAVGLAAAGQAPEVRDGDRHFGARDSMVVRRRPPRLKVHAEVAHRDVADVGVGQRHLESLRGPLAVLADAHAAQLAQVLRVVEAGVQHVEAVGVAAVAGEAQRLVVGHGAAVAVGVHAAAALGGAAHRRHAVAQRCNAHTAAQVNTGIRAAFDSSSIRRYQADSLKLETKSLK